MTGTSCSSGIARAIMRWIMAAFFVAAGVAHLRVPNQLLAITPEWVPYYAGVIDWLFARNSCCHNDSD